MMTESVSGCDPVEIQNDPLPKNAEPLSPSRARKEHVREKDILGILPDQKASVRMTGYQQHAAHQTVRHSGH